MSADTQTSLSPELETRRAAMALLANAPEETLKAAWDALDTPPAHTVIRQPETGLVMVRGRAGGTGAPFNLCEATVTRCVVALDTGETGFGQSLGRSKAKALYSAIFDALLQTKDWSEYVETHVLQPLNTATQAAEHQTREEVAATKVDFFTMVRGD
ncbi:phosphonate C-P lyase system protein PhnG [Pseudovibrio exalbescens]|uniref:Phosphonate C-P lyase system protein PhnG n=1 Tax=Pseudovibrio exalbescens TaxID=197461 RepID=A0A1U7JGT9_9HYPH|nr:phosphonate C-P lyase system protein PhnG [Pseudovibrio exalbescens]OKL43963.1 phosphonate C-P lyase system protein PhnG [Pseudovibrio exalbescens]